MVMHAIPLRRPCFAIVAAGAIALSKLALASPIEHSVDHPGPFPYGSHSVNTGTTSPVQVDNYTFSGFAGDHARIVVSGLTGGFDAELVLRDPAGTALKTAQCSRGVLTCSTILDQVLPVTGTYTINVSD